mmetsp:Transcript_91162/g.294574  ORF Transcript_91162/g.294574 Transcript_91162/m.294574 type:complete len:80 (+) Transcript_91162:204-443(+)
MQVEVYSRTEECWLVGHVVDPVVPGLITVEFMLRGQCHRKTLDPSAVLEELGDVHVALGDREGAERFRAAAHLQRPHDR